MIAENLSVFVLNIEDTMLTLDYKHALNHHEIKDTPVIHGPNKYLVREVNDENKMLLIRNEVTGKIVLRVKGWDLNKALNWIKL